MEKYYLYFQQERGKRNYFEICQNILPNKAYPQEMIVNLSLAYWGIFRILNWEEGNTNLQPTLAIQFHLREEKKNKKQFWSSQSKGIGSL